MKCRNDKSSPMFQQYKTYRNNLTALLRKVEKDHYHKLLEANKNNKKKHRKL